MVLLAAILYTFAYGFANKMTIYLGVVPSMDKSGQLLIT